MRKRIEKENNAQKLFVILSFIFVVTIISLIVCTQFYFKDKETNNQVYKKHYMFVSQTKNAFIENQIYDEAKAYGEQLGIYVDRLGDLSESDYGISDYLKMAISMRVDGIILEGSEEEEVKMTVNQAAEMEIPVVTFLSDCAGSRRKSYITLGDYNLGREYVRQIISITKTRTPKVVLLMDADAKENEDQILTGLQETLKNEGNHLQTAFRVEELDSETNLKMTQKINELLTQENTRPDILICMNEKDTKMVYQYLIDYDLKGKVQIIGSCETESLLKAVRDGEIAALVHVDTEQVARGCLDALEYYMENGSVKEYIIVDDTVITDENVKRYLGDE